MVMKMKNQDYMPVILTINTNDYDFDETICPVSVYIIELLLSPRIVASFTFYMIPSPEFSASMVYTLTKPSTATLAFLTVAYH
jgi:hypothetical protein